MPFHPLRVGRKPVCTCEDTHEKGKQAVETKPAHMGSPAVESDSSRELLPALSLSAEVNSIAGEELYQLSNQSPSFLERQHFYIKGTMRGSAPPPCRVSLSQRSSVVGRSWALEALGDPSPPRAERALRVGCPAVFLGRELWPCRSLLS